MAADFKITTFYGQGAFGWSESWWKNAATLGALQEPVGVMLALRQAMLSTRVACLGVRISTFRLDRTGRVYAPGISAMFRGGPSITIPEFGSIEDRPTGNDPITFDQVRACLRYEVVDGARRLSYRYLCGIPDQVSLTEPAVTHFGAPATWWLAYNAWRQYMRVNFLIHATKTGAVGETIPIIRWARIDAAAGVIGCVTKAGGPLNPLEGSRVVVTGVRMRARGVRSPNGVWVVDSTANGVAPEQTIYLRGSETRDIAQIKSPGKVRIQQDILVSFDDLFPFRTGIHRRGGPFGQLVGRRTTPQYIV